MRSRRKEQRPAFPGHECCVGTFVSVISLVSPVADISPEADIIPGFHSAFKMQNGLWSLNDQISCAGSSWECAYQSETLLQA